MYLGLRWLNGLLGFTASWCAILVSWGLAMVVSSPALVDGKSRVHSQLEIKTHLREE